MSKVTAFVGKINGKKTATRDKSSIFETFTKSVWELATLTSLLVV
jgi:hypothetical protein